MVFEVISAAAGTATAFGIFLAWIQLKEAKAQRAAEQSRERAEFELRFSTRYDDCVRRIPLEVLLGAVYDRSSRRTRRAFYDYFELCEQECYYNTRGQITAETWNEWAEGITSNFRKPAFMAAWADLSASSNGQFELLRERLSELVPDSPVERGLGECD